MPDVVKILRGLHEAATKGPWDAFVVMHDGHTSGSTIAVGAGLDKNRRRREVVGWTGFDASDITDHSERAANARLIATLRTLLPELIGVVEAAEEVYDGGGTGGLFDALVALATAAAAVEKEVRGG